jgi:hypothetical protein
MGEGKKTLIIKVVGINHHIFSHVVATSAMQGFEHMKKEKNTNF